MQKLVVIKLEGSFLQGFKVNVEIAQETKRPSIELNGELPSEPEIPEIYQAWSDSYYYLDVINRLTPVNIADDDYDWENSKINCDQKSQNLITSFNNWLKSASFTTVREKCLEQLKSDDEIRVIIRTSNHLLRKLPWHLWDLWQKYPLAEVALSTLNSQVTDRIQHQKARVLIVLGNSQGIDVTVDRSLLAQFCRDAEIVFLLEPSPQELNQHLWDAIGWDIILFSGHSRTEGKRGRIFLNQKDSLTMTELKYALQTAVERGLQIGFFNSCDGLGIATELENLHIPQLIVMRELVPDLVAHQFLKYFLEEYTSGKSLYLAVGIARKKLQGIETDFPCASWLPVIVQNLLETPPTWQSLGVIAQCPYRGLAAFREEDAAFFYGRESVCSQLVTAVTNKPLVGVIGASGSGKSSSVFAGLIPSLRQDRHNQWQIVTFRPGKNPFEALALALLAVLPSQANDNSIQLQELEHQLRADTSTLQNLIKSYFFAQPSSATLPLSRFLLVADQFEEVYTLYPNAEERKIFLDGLLNVVENIPLFTLVFTLRADFLGKAINYAPLGKALQDYPPELLIPLNREELEQAIALPAQKLNVKLEAGLTKAIASDLGDSRGSLPMLQFALAQLWTKQHSGWLTHQAYQEIGGALKALANHAEAVYARLDEQQRKVAQQIFIQLVQPGDGVEDTRRLATRIEIGENNWELVTLLASERLLVSNYDPSTKTETVEIVHEALIFNWGRLGQWINSNREFRIWQERLKMSLRHWQTTNFDEGDLLRGASLSEAEQWLEKRFPEISPAQKDYIQQGIKLQKNKIQQEKQQRRQTMIGLFGGIVLALGLAGTAVWQWRQAAIKQINSVSISSSALLKSNRELDALLEALKAARQLKYSIWRNADTSDQVYLSLQQAVYNARERNRLEGHKDGINSVDFSPDGQMIVSASRDKTIVLWSKDGRKLRTFIGHDREVSSVSFSPDGRIIASASYDGKIKLWNINGQQLKTFSGNGGQISHISFSPDGNTIILSTLHDKIIEIWSINGRQLKSIEARLLQNWQGGSFIKFSPDGNMTAAKMDGTIQRWTRDGQELRTLGKSKINTIGTWDINFSPNGQIIATANLNGTIKLWNFKGQLLRTLASSTNTATNVSFNPRISFSPDGQTIAVAGPDGTIKLWNVNGQEIKTLKGHVENVTSLSFSPNGKNLISGSLDHTIKVWDLEHQESKILNASNLPLWGVSFSPNGKIIASAGTDNNIKLWHLNGKLIRKIKTAKSDRGWISGINFSPDGRTIASTSWDNTIKLWSLNGRRIKIFKGHTGLTNDVSFSPNGQFIASASDDQTIKLWRINGQLFKTFAGHHGGVWSLSFSPDGKKIASADRHGVIGIWTWQGKLLKMFKAHGSLASVSFSPDGKILASGSSDKTIKLWSLDGRQLKTLAGHTGAVSKVRFSPNGKLVASSSSDGAIAIWDIISGKQLKTIEGNGYVVWNLSFSPDGKVIAAVNENGLLQIWHSETLNFDQLIQRGCFLVHDYLQNNLNVDVSEQHLCD